MQRRKQLFRLSLVIMALVFSSLAARAGNLPLETFYGRYAGSGFTHGDYDYYELTYRDLDVEIGQEDGGFFVAWTTVFRPQGTNRPRRKSTRISFVPSGRRGIYVERAAKAPVENGLSWAVVTGTDLTVRVLEILDDGSYETQIYHRIIFENGMMLQFRSDQDGKTTRLLSAKLTKKK